MVTTAFRGMNPFAQLMFALFVMVASVLAFMVIGTIVAIPFFGISEMVNSVSAEPLQNINILKYFQVIQSIGLFVIPPFILGLLYHGNNGEYLQINRSTRWQSYALAALAILISIPLVNFLGDINSQMKFPEAFSGLEAWMRKMEDAAEVLVEKFMKVEGLSGLLFNIFMIAVIPALGEELMFRGVVQRIFTGWTKNHHWGIWITAFLFSAMHMQFYGFIPRMALGAMFGYLLIWTGTMWVPILAHFVNNTMGVMGYFLINQGVISKDIEKWGTGHGQFPLVILCFVITGVLLFLIFRSEQSQTKMPVNQIDSQASRID